MDCETLLILSFYLSIPTGYRSISSLHIHKIIKITENERERYSDDTILSALRTPRLAVAGCWKAIW